MISMCFSHHRESRFIGKLRFVVLPPFRFSTEYSAVLQEYVRILARKLSINTYVPRQNIHVYIHLFILMYYS